MGDIFSDAWDWLEEEIIEPVVGEDNWDSFTGFVDDTIEDIMGIIGIEGETVVAVEVITVPLISDPPKNPIQGIIFRHAIDNKSIADGFKREYVTGISASLRSYAYYGANTYVHGIPTSTLNYSDTRKSDVETVIASIELEPVTSSFVRLAVPKMDNWVRWYLQESEIFNYHTGVCNIAGVDWLYTGAELNGLGTEYIANFSNVIITTTVISLDIVINTVGGTETTTTTEKTEVTVDDGTNPPDVTTTYGTPVVTQQPGDGSNDGVFNTGLTSNVVEDGQTTTITGILKPLEEFYYTVIYSLDSDPTVNKVWIYRRALGTYPALNIVPASGTDGTGMLSIVPVRENNVSINNDLLSPEYLTTYELLRKVGINLDTILNSIHDNPDIDLISDVFILFGLNVYTDTVHGKQLLFLLFNNLFTNLAIDITTYNNADYPKPANTYHVQEQNYNTLVRYNYITRTLDILGTVCPLGECTVSHTILPNEPIVVDEETDEETGGDILSYMTIQYQITETTYHELKVHGLYMVTSIVSIATGEAKTKLVALSEDEAERNNFILPVSHNMIDSFELTEEQDLIYETLHLVIYAQDSQYLEWYETPRFIGLVDVAFKALAIFSLISGSGNLSTFLWELGKTLLIQAALDAVLEDILEDIEPDDVDARNTAVTLHAIGTFYNWGGGRDGLSFADQLLVGVSSVGQSAAIDIADQFETLNEDFADLNSTYEDQQDELDAIQAGLDPYSDSDLEVYDVLQVVENNPYESPTEFYSRTVHTGNPGVLALSQIESYVDNALKLPEFKPGIIR